MNTKNDKNNMILNFFNKKLMPHHFLHHDKPVN